MIAADASLRAEADRLLASGLRTLLDTFGEVHVVGSYALRLMAWRDLDIHIACADVDLGRFFELGGAVAALLSPVKMHFRNELIAGTPGLPRGLYWGVYLGDEKRGAWKIDIWTATADQFTAAFEFQRWVGERLTPERRSAILHIKTAVWNHPEYRRAFSSADIYRAVIERGISDPQHFLAWISTQ